MSKWVEEEPHKFCTTPQLLKNYNRNKVLIDFDYVPEDMEQKIMQEFNSLNISEKKVPLEYFQRYQLNDLMEDFFFRSSIPFKK